MQIDKVVIMDSCIDTGHWNIRVDLDELEHLWQLANYAYRKGDDLFQLDRDKARNKEIHNIIVKALGFGQENFIKQ